MKILGYIILSIPFVALIGFSIASIGMLATLMVLLATASIVACVSLGVYLIH